MNNYSNKLDLDRFFFEARDQVYALIKCNDFPNYYQGSDVDIFCYDMDAFARTVIGVGNQYLDQGFEIRVTGKDMQTYVDFYLDDQLEFRFDLYQTLPQYKKLCIKEHFFLSVIENASSIDRIHNGVQYPLYVPSAVDEMMLRYIEYIEWYETRPDKVKHLDFIIDTISADASRINFLDKLHVYTKLPEVKYGRTGLYQYYWYRKGKSWITRLQKIPLHRIPGLIINKIVGKILPSRKKRSSD